MLRDSALDEGDIVATVALISVVTGTVTLEHGEPLGASTLIWGLLRCSGVSRPVWTWAWCVVTAFAIVASLWRAL